MNIIDIHDKFIMWSNENQTLIRQKDGYILAIQKPFHTFIQGISIDDVIGQYKKANSSYWNMIKEERGTKKVKKRK